MACFFLASRLTTMSLDIQCYSLDSNNSSIFWFYITIIYKPVVVPLLNKDSDTHVQMHSWSSQDGERETNETIELTFKPVSSLTCFIRHLPSIYINASSRHLSRIHMLCTK